MNFEISTDIDPISMKNKIKIIISKPKQLEPYEETKTENRPNGMRVIWTDEILKKKFSIKKKLKKKKNKIKK